MRPLWPFLLLCLAVFDRPAFAQPATQITLADSIVALNGPWKFHTGDDPRWASPDFNDSTWETVDLTSNEDRVDPGLGSSGYVPGWTALGHPGYWGYAWYRIRVRIASQPVHATPRKLAIDLSASVDDAYQLFANGQLLGSFGDFPPSGKSPVTFNGQPGRFLLPSTQAAPGASLPASPSPPAADLFIAVRVWMEPSTLTNAPDVGGLHRAPMLGQASSVAAQYQLDWLDILRSYAFQAILAALFLLLAILACCLSLFDRSDPVYLWLSAVFLLTAMDAASLCLAAWTRIESLLILNLTQDVLLRALTLGGWVMVWWVWFGLGRSKHPAWIPRLLAAITLLYMLSNALAEDIFFTVVPHAVSLVCHDISIAVRLIFLSLLILIVTWGIRRQGREGWLALPAVVLVGIAQFQTDLQFLHIPTVWFPFGVQFSIADIARPVLVAAISALLLRRLLASTRRQREMALDIKQAQEVQQVLIPEDAPYVPGLTIESEYRPAREVGGDFFQILPYQSSSSDGSPLDGSVLIVVGDVTGKGLQAGMLVALIVGAIRNQAETSFDPRLMIENLNRRLCGRGSAHATCLALTITRDGAATLVNAGHLAPYLNGKELPMEGALPLGMIPGAEFSILHFQLKDEDRLFLMTDGVAEAQSPQNELFGFARIESLLKASTTAAELATAAQSFSQPATKPHDLHQAQSDDILILRIVKEPTAA